MKISGLKLAFVAVVVGGLAASWIYYSGSRSGANKNELQKVRAVIVTKASEGKVIDHERLLAGKAAAASQATSNGSRARAVEARRVLRVADSVGEIPAKLEQPIADLVTHTDNLERENSDLHQLAHVDTTKIVNLTEQLGLSKKELELTPKPSRCGAKCGITLGILGTLAVIIAAGHAR